MFVHKAILALSDLVILPDISLFHFYHSYPLSLSSSHTLPRYGKGVGKIYEARKVG